MLDGTEIEFLRPKSKRLPQVDPFTGYNFRTKVLTSSSQWSNFKIMVPVEEEDYSVGPYFSTLLLFGLASKHGLGAEPHFRVRNFLPPFAPQSFPSTFPQDLSAPIPTVTVQLCLHINNN
jgi:hypothetical protein